MSTQFFLTILLMALATYLTRIGGYLLLRKHQPSPRVAAILDAAPGCVLISVIAPHFASGHVADLAALGITALAASRLSMLPTVLIGVASAAALRGLL
ncbi:AzlD family protein [Luteolibacter luteus]|uniref:AzlD family protein n=1 Tax=Luteolibacter luteus TaxID=2728835 RepID=A0A858RDF1_9BACT|nr:AzlD family protein [Luteolibacter luteus]QJE95096.1 AzlD family protein [Luteolibacter luteus]